MPPQRKLLRIVHPRSGRKRDGFHVFMENLPRLSNGNSCTLLLLTLWAQSAGDGQRRHDWTRALAVRDLAQICRCHVRTLQRLIAWLDERGVVQVRRPGIGLIEIRLMYRQWASLPDLGTPPQAVA
jgi:hypothetical protein